MNSKAIRKQLLAAVAMVLVAAVALGSSTYAWFVTNTQVTATKVDVTAATAYNLLISTTKDGTYGSVMTLDPNSAALTQVSTIGTRATTTTAMSDSTNADAGDILFVTSDKWVANLVTTWKTISKNSVTTLPGSAGTAKMYYTDTAWLKAASTADIYLDKDGTGLNWAKYDSSTNSKRADTATFYTYATFLTGAAKETGGTLTDDQKTYNAEVDQAIALLKTMRVGFKVTQTTVNGATTEADNFYVYAFAASDANISTAVDTSTGTADGYTRAVGQAAPGTADTAPSAYTTANISNLNTNTIKVLTDGNMADGDGTSIGTRQSGDKLASVNPNEQVQVDIYVWMEGCDGDTIAGNISSFADAKITGMQFGFCLAE